MLLKRLTALVATMAAAMTFSTTTAIADDVMTSWQHMGPGDVCLDFRSDRGPYVTGCNYGRYQAWTWDDDPGFTTMKQLATGLCLTLRTSGLTMKPCNGDIDRLQGWRLQYTAAGALIRNRVHDNMCVARKANNDVHATTCTGGTSQLWLRGHVDP